MRALILSDIHANLDALDAVLAAAPAHDTVWNLGDIVGYGALPNETAKRAREIGTLFVRGNHDRACTGRSEPADFNPIATRAVLWTQQTLTPENADWLRHLAVGPVFPKTEREPPRTAPADESRAVSCSHGSPLDEDEYLTSEEDAWLPLRYAPAGVNFFGHTHTQGGFASDREEIGRLRSEIPDGNGHEAAEISLQRSLRYLINPGSVGQPRDGDWRAAFALFDDERMTIEFHRVPYDVRLAQMRILRAGLPDHLALRLREGR
jgi:predicted phosphodiesterase